jgi:hypothetical protein
MLEQGKEIIEAHKEKCFRCGGAVAKDSNGCYKCPICSFEWGILFIKRVPKPTLLLFKDFAEAECTSDYGMALKALMDAAVSNASTGALIENIKVLEQRIGALEGTKAKEPGKVIRLVNGKEITGGREHGKI